MKKKSCTNISLVPLALWFVIIPVVVKVKLFDNPLVEYPWYSQTPLLADFFLYYKSWLVAITGALMLLILFWNISKMKTKDFLIGREIWIFIPIIIYLVLSICSSLFSAYSFYSIHGMPDQFETIWNLIAYVIAAIYCYYVIVYENADKTILCLIYLGAGLVGIICILQYVKIDIYRLIYAGEGYSFTFAPGQVYGPFYNINYVGYYTLLFLPLFVLLVIFYKNIKVRVVSAGMALMLLLALIGADSATSQIALAIVCVFAMLFLLCKNIKKKRILSIFLTIFLVGVIGTCMLLFPRISAYIQGCDTEKRNIESIYTTDDYVQINYKGQKLFIEMVQTEAGIHFDIKDQNHAEVVNELSYMEGDYYYYQITDKRFAGIELTPVIITNEPMAYGFTVQLDDKKWCFTNQMSEDGTYYYFTDQGRLTKLTDENISADFEPLVHMSGLANGRGYIWNKTIAILKNYIILGSGADTFTVVFPNNDIVDKYNNGYGDMFITKPHNLYLQIAVQTGVLSLICFLMFYLWYFISSLKLYFKLKLDNPLTLTGFAIMLGTCGYMISGLANDSTITVTPLYWALMGVGIGINHKLHLKKE